MQHYDGPFVTPDDARKENAVLRYSEGDERNGYSITGMAYHQLWTNTTDIPVRAIAEGLVAGRFGTLDPPTAAARGARACRSMATRRWVRVSSSASAFFIDNQLHLWNDFTHYLMDPVHGDQEDQFENRRAFGGQGGLHVAGAFGLDRQ